MAGKSLAPITVDPDYLARLEELATRKERAIERLRVARERMGEWRAVRGQALSRERMGVLLDALAAGMTVAAACRAAGVHSRTAYHYKAKNEEFAREWAAALDAGCEPIEDALLDSLELAPADSMAKVRAAEVLLRGRSARYGNHGGRQAVATLKQGGEGGGSLSLQMGTHPFPD